MNIRGFLKTSFIDYPGKVAAVIWTSGCNFRCPICYNVELVLNPATLPPVTESRVLAWLEKERLFLDGLVITGGEPTNQSDLIPFLEKIKARNFLTKLDTNGSRPEVIEQALKRGLLDFIAVDIKTPPGIERYRKVCGLTEAEAETAVANISRTVDLILHDKVEYELRTTVADGLLDEDDLLEIGRFCKERAPEGRKPNRYAVQNFFPAATLDPAYRDSKPWPENRLKSAQKDLEQFFETVLIRSR